MLKTIHGWVGRLLCLLGRHRWGPDGVLLDYNPPHGGTWFKECLRCGRLEDL